MRASLIALFLISLMGCDPPSQADPARFGTVTVFIAPEWLNIDKERIRAELVNLNALGPLFVESGEGNRSISRIVVQPFDSNGCTLGAGRWIVGSRVVEVDPTCTPGDTAFRQAVGHEVGHALGMSHICQHPDDAPDCSPVGHGPAMMNPQLGGSSTPIGFNEAFNGRLAEDQPTVLDLAEYRRIAAIDGGTR